MFSVLHHTYSYVTEFSVSNCAANYGPSKVCLNDRCLSLCRKLRLSVLLSTANDFACDRMMNLIEADPEGIKAKLPV